MASRFETLQIHAGQDTDPVTKSRAVPIYQTAYFNFDDSAHAARCYGLEEDGHIGTRTSNPTTDVLEKRMAALEGGLASVAVASGQSAVFMTMLCLAGRGESIISTANMYHGAYNQFSFLLPDLGISVDIVQEIPESIEAAINETTRAIYLESMGHPRMNVPDIEAIAQVAHRHGIPLVVDNTAGAGGYWCQPILHGADIVTHSASKWICGHGTSVGGVVVDSGRFDWRSPRFTKLNQPNPGFHNINFHESFGKLAFVNRFGDAKSAATHPWSSTHKPMYPEEKIDLGVTEDMVRMSVGLEHIEDIKQDIQQSLDACSTVSKK
ncbi:Homocysteine synthase [Colletotrichum sp. SAR 10_96]|nr:Homocysteine synthase [Colletotrichum sp. SAR 10_96]